MLAVSLLDSRGGGEQGDKVSSTVRIAMARREDEFRNILLSHTSPLETADSLTTKLSSSAHSLISSSNATDVVFVDDDPAHGELELQRSASRIKQEEQ